MLREIVVVKVNVANLGVYAGKETVQLRAPEVLFQKGPLANMKLKTLAGVTEKVREVQYVPPADRGRVEGAGYGILLRPFGDAGACTHG